MRYSKPPFLFWIIMLMCANIAYATGLVDLGVQWSGQANAGQDLSICSYCGYSLNYPSAYNITSNTSYQTCDIRGASITPLMDDINNDNYEEVILVTGSTLYTYNRYCSELTSTALGESYNPGGLAVNNWDGDSEPDIILSTDKGINSYRWNSAEYVLYLNWTNASFSNFFISCPPISDQCLLFANSYNNKTVKILDLETGIFSGAGVDDHDTQRANSYYEQTPFYIYGSNEYSVYCFANTVSGDDWYICSWCR